uniref:Uncharacterized protein n=1 Tax=Equus caballus TaxID=9796 RepID=A0A3Q2H9K2_HORSE
SSWPQQHLHKPPPWFFSEFTWVCVWGVMVRGRGRVRGSERDSGRRLHREKAFPGLPGPRPQAPVSSYSPPVSGLSFINRSDLWLLAWGHFQLPTSRLPVFFTPGSPAHSPPLGQLGRRPTTGADQLPASKETQAHSSPRVSRKACPLWWGVDFPTLFRRPFGCSTGHLKFTMRVKWECTHACTYEICCYHRWVSWAACASVSP